MSRRRHLAVLLAAAMLVAGCTGPGTATTHDVTTHEATTAATISTSILTPAPTSDALEPMDHSSDPAMVMSVSPATAPVNTAAAGPGPSAPPAPLPAAPAGPAIDVLPGMPAVPDPHNIYSEAGAGMLGHAALASKAYAYVPNTKSGDVWVIDQQTFQVVGKFPVGKEVQHVVPSYDMSSLYATDDIGNVIRRIDPTTGQAGETIPVADPYNMYFTPDGKYAISVAEALRSLVWYDPATWQEVDRVRYPDCKGIDHGDFTPDGKIAVFSCEFAGRVAVIDMQTHQLIRMVDMPQMNTTMGPQDLRIAPDGSKFYIADSDSDGVWVLDKDLQTVTRHIDTGDGAHGLYFSRDAAELYITNRHEGPLSRTSTMSAAVPTVLESV